MLGIAYFGIQTGQNGAISAATGMVLGAIIEIGYLFYSWQVYTKVRS
jgi:hypothetical protein